MKTGVVLAVTVLGSLVGCGPNEVIIGGTGGSGGLDESGVGGTVHGGGSSGRTWVEGDTGGAPDGIPLAGYGGTAGRVEAAGGSGGFGSPAGTAASSGYDGTGGYATGIAGAGAYGAGGYGRAGSDPTTGYAGEPGEAAGGSYATAGGGYATAGRTSGGGSGGYGYAGGGPIACTSDTIFSADGACQDDDVLLGRAYQVCVDAEMTVSSVTFERCGGNTSSALYLTCCSTSGTGGGGSPAQNEGGAPQ